MAASGCQRLRHPGRPSAKKTCLGPRWLHEPRVKNERAYRLPHNQYRCAEEVARTKHRCEPVGSV